MGRTDSRLFPRCVELVEEAQVFFSQICSILLEVEEGLGFYHCDLVGVGGEGVYVQLGSPCFEVDVAEWLEVADLDVGEGDEDSAVAGETFEVLVALLIEVGAHLFDLEVGHIADAPAERTLVGSWAAELESLDKAS